MPQYLVRCRYTPEVLKGLVSNPEDRIVLGETVRGIEGGGAGYGDPRTREPVRVLRDVERGWETQERATALYAVVLTGSLDDDILALDAEATDDLRAQIMGS